MTSLFGKNDDYCEQQAEERKLSEPGHKLVFIEVLAHGVDAAETRHQPSGEGNSEILINGIEVSKSHKEEYHEHSRWPQTEQCRNSPTQSPQCLK